jgi:GT2 family glycosyltransferase
MEIKNILPKVVVLTINYNQNDFTIKCIRSLLKNEYENFSILLIDNGSTIENYEKLKIQIPINNKVSVHRVENNLGYVGAINIGLKKIESMMTEYILIMNNDTIIGIDAIKELVNVSERNNKKVIVSGKVYDYQNKNILQYIGQYKDITGGIRHPAVIKYGGEIDSGKYENEMEMGMLDDVFWLIPVPLYQKIGGYSDYFYLYGEQNDFAMRAVSNNYRLIYTPKAHIWHMGQATTSQSIEHHPKITYWKVQGALKLAYLHLPADKINAYVMKFMIRQIMNVIILILIKKINIKNLYAVVIAYWHCKHWSIIKYKDNGYNPYNS